MRQLFANLFDQRVKNPKEKYSRHSFTNSIWNMSAHAHTYTHTQTHEDNAITIESEFCLSIDFHLLNYFESKWIRRVMPSGVGWTLNKSTDWLAARENFSVCEFDLLTKIVYFSNQCVSCSRWMDDVCVHKKFLWWLNEGQMVQGIVWEWNAVGVFSSIFVKEKYEMEKPIEMK